jgi:iron complex outermembrane receptor protein
MSVHFRFTAIHPVFRRRPTFPRGRSLIQAALVIQTALMGAASAVAQEPGRDRVATTDTVLVVGRHLSPGAETIAVAPGRDLAGLLGPSPFVLVNRGAAGASDLYADGFRRHDLTFTVDCERCETACPNRMDTRVGQVDLLEIDSIELARDGAALQSGLGGTLAMRRSVPGDTWLLRGRLEALTGRGETVDGSVSAEARGLRMASRWRRVEAFTDAGGRTFADLYGFAQVPNTVIGEIRGQARLAHGDARGSFERSRELLFPYLLMDERRNDRWEASGSWRGHHVYANHTAHLMDNRLRRSIGTTVMVTDAANTMVGAVGDRYEIYGRHWDADNSITPVANPAAATTSHMLPDVWRWGATVRHALGAEDHPWLVARFGLARTKVHDAAQLAAFSPVHADAELEKWSVPFGVTVSRTRFSGATALTGALEVAADAPGIEQQFIVVDKPGMTPDWVGNPGLDDPIRGTLRLGAERGVLRAELFGTRVNDYPVLERRTVGGLPCQTYAGVPALLAGASARVSWELVAVAVRWNWGEHVDGKAPLAEIHPLTFDLDLRSPSWRHCTARAVYRHAERQGRVDLAQAEAATEAWNRLDLALAWERGGARYELALDNATNALYTQHLSYQRNPFASGLRVWEPGRQARLSAAFGF